MKKERTQLSPSTAADSDHPSPLRERGAAQTPLRGEADGPAHLVMSVADRGKVAFAREQRREPTYTEALLWRRLRKNQLGVKFRRQHPLYDFVLDFYCDEAALVVEVDGSIHRRRAEYDAWREAILAANGLRVLRFPEAEVRAHLPQVLRTIRASLPASALAPKEDST